MIHKAPHRVTKRMRTVVECDTEGCPESHYLADDIGVGHGATLMRSVGWQVRQTESVPYRFSAHCPAHTDQRVCPHDERAVYLAGKFRCALCCGVVAYAHGGKWVTA
jgi:hypothetical protein